MKNIVTMMFAGVALIAFPAAAQAQCNLIAGGNTSLDALLTFNGQPAPAPATQVAPLAAEALMKVPAYKTAVAGCTEADVARELSRLNWPDSSKLISVSDQFIVPKLAPAVQAPTPDTTVVVTVTETPTVKPVTEPSAELRRTQAELQTAKQQQNVLKAQVAAIAARPKNTQLSPADRAKVDQLLKVNGEIKALETRLKEYVDAENAKQNVAIATAGTDAATAKADAAKAIRIANGAQETANNAGGVPNWLLGVLVALGLGLLGLLIWFIVNRRTVGRTLKVHTQDIETVHNRVDVMGDALPADIKLILYWQEVLSNLAIGDSTILEVCQKDDNGYEPRFTIEVKKVSDDEVECLRGIKGHVSTNAIKIAKLERTVRKAGFKNLLETPILQLRSVAA